MDPTDVPQDFPEEFLGAASGAQPKLLVQKNERGEYVSTADTERAERWAICADLTEQLVDYVHKHRCEHPSETALVENVVRAIELKRGGWGISKLEVAWIEQELRARFAPG